MGSLTNLYLHQSRLYQTEHLGLSLGQRLHTNVNPGLIRQSLHTDANPGLNRPH